MRSRDGFKDPRTMAVALIVFSVLTMACAIAFVTRLWWHPLSPDAHDWRLAD